LTGQKDWVAAIEEGSLAVTLRPYQGAADTLAMQRLASRLWPLGMHPGGVGWVCATEQLPASLMLAVDPGHAGDSGEAAIAGWAGLTGVTLDLAVDQASPWAAEALIQWAVRTAGQAELTVAVHDSDETVRTAVMAAGFAEKPGADPAAAMFLTAAAARQADDDGPALPDGYVIRSVRDEELEARVEVHRASWRPITLPWPDGVPAAVSPETTSRFTAALYEQVRSTWLYDPDLDLVVVAQDGTLAACCIAWYDPATCTAEIEPLGVAPAHRRKGLAVALCLAVAALVASRGGDQVYINTWLRPDYPAPALTYLTAGFTIAQRARLYHRGQAG
jgi:GNAT superfamily N-acetyltransferase